MLTYRFRTLAILAIALFLVLSPPFAAQTDEDKEKAEAEEKVYTNKDAEKAKAVDEKNKVWTTDDLERMFGGGEPPAEAAEPGEGETAGPATGKPAEQEDPLQRMQRQRSEQADRQKAIAEAEARVAELKKRVADYESGLLSVRNTLLSRRVAPKKPEEGSEAAEGWDQLDNAERVERTEKELEKAREELKQAEAELARLRSG